MLPTRAYIYDILHMRSIPDVILNGVLTIIGGFIGYFTDIINVNSDAFFAIALVVGIDFIFGVMKAFKKNNFETRKALKVVWYFFAYSFLGFPQAYITKNTACNRCFLSLKGSQLISGLLVCHMRTVYADFPYIHHSVQIYSEMPVWLLLRCQKHV